MRGAPGEQYEQVHEGRIHVGDIVIVERLRFDFKTGAPVDSEYYRAVIGQHNTVSGPRYHMTNEPDAEFPAFAPWSGRWIYATADSVTNIWRKNRLLNQ